MSQIKNAIVGQSGGPTAAINSSLAGVISQFSKISSSVLYGATNGVKGILRDNIINLSEIFSDDEKIRLLMQTPSSYLGSCRYRLKNDNYEDIENILNTFKKHNIGYFFYIGGNDSMDTVLKLSNILKERKSDIKVIGIPKTIDNDLVGIDHCPGFGSCAKYISASVSEMAQDAGCYDIKNVLIVEIMGRNAGWLTASSALGRDENISAPDLIYLPERPFDPEMFLYDIRQKLLTQNTVVVAVSEGIKSKNGIYIAQELQCGKQDMFGHGQLGGAAKKLEQLVKEKLGIKVRSVELNIAQRCGSHITSLTDIQEAFSCGEYAVKSAFSGETGKMVTMKRKDGNKYSIEYDSIDISLVANSEKNVPDIFIDSSGNNITDEFIKYVSPLIKGENNIVYKNGIPAHIMR